MEHESHTCDVHERRMYVLLSLHDEQKVTIFALADDPWRTLSIASFEENAPSRFGNINIPTHVFVHQLESPRINLRFFTGATPNHRPANTLGLCTVVRSIAQI
jgi:hypothetical protein